MSFQLKKLEQAMAENEIKVYSTTIQGDNLDDENIIKIEIQEDNSEPNYIEGGKNKKRLEVSSIIPNISYTRGIVTKFACER